MVIVCDKSSLCYEYVRSEVLNGFYPFQLVFICDPLDLTSLSFPKIDTIPVTYREYYNLLFGQITKKEIFENDQMVYLYHTHQHCKLAQ